MKYRWAVTKARMVGLAGQYTEITRPETAEFTHFEKSWWLDFTQDGAEHHFWLCALDDLILFTHRVRRFGEDGRRHEDYNGYDLTPEELVNLGLLRSVRPQQ